MDQLLLLPCPRVLACSWWGPAAAIPQASLQRFAAARTVGKSQVPGSVALATTSRRVSRPSFCGGERCCRCRWCCCPALLDFSCVGRLGTLAAAASPQTKPPAGVVAAHGCPPTPARDRKPGNAATAFRRPGWKAVAAVRVLAGRCLGGSRRAFSRPKWTGNGTQITYANPRSCGPIFLKYENKRDWLRAGFDRQAGRPGRFAGSAGREDSGNGNGSRCRASGRDC